MKPLTPITKELYRWLKLRGYTRSQALKPKNKRRHIRYTDKPTDREKRIRQGQLPLF